MEIHEFEGENYKDKTALRQIMLTHDDTNNSLFTRPKKLDLFDFQFFPKELKDLVQKEDELYEQRKVLDEVDSERKDILYTQGFLNWNRRDFQQFIKATEAYGKEFTDKYAEFI